MPWQDARVQAKSETAATWIGAGVLGAVLIGCGSSGAVQLRELGRSSMYVTWYAASLGRQLELPHFYVQIEFAHPEDECATLVPATTATVDSVPLVVSSLGGWEALGTRTYCAVPTFVYPGDQVNAHPIEDVTTIEVSDGVDAFRARARNLFAYREVAFEEPAAGVLEPGAHATVRWSPASDRSGLVVVSFLRDDSVPGPGGTASPSFVLSTSQLAISGDRIGFDVPDVEPQAGMLDVEMSAHVPIATCEGFARCDAAVFSVSRTVVARIE